MQEENSIPSFRKKIVLSLLGFIVFYAISLVFWLNVQDYYGRGILTIASHVSAKVKNVDFETIVTRKDGTQGARFYISRKGKGATIIFKFDVSQFTYNVPLTFGIMAALSLFISRHVKAYAESLIMLFTIHLFYVFTSEAGRITYILAQNRLEAVSEFGQFVWQYAWGFLDAMVIRFEPFLIGFYLIVRFSSFSFIRRRERG
jgi:hypothetical protein